MVLFREFARTKVLNEEGKVVSRDTNLRNKLVVKNKRLVTFVINKFYGKHKLSPQTKEDLFQEGCLSLFDAIDHFDPSLGFKFSTYATWWVRQACGNYLLDKIETIPVPSHVRTARNKMYRLLEKDDDPSVMWNRQVLLGKLDNVEAATKFGVSDKMLESVKAALLTGRIKSLDAPVKGWNEADSTNSTLGDRLQSHEHRTPDEILDAGVLVSAAARALGTMSERERLILLLRYNVIDSITPGKEPAQ